MSFGIKFLPPEIVSLIAAGEVIDSIAAVVRELVENSLDAGANRIVISLWTDLWRVQVADNGTGMSLTDLRMCAMAHSTSKIHTHDDLNQISTLGFRGEALYSLTQVADIEIISRSSLETDSPGWQIVYQEGKLTHEEVRAIATGTIVTVYNLFGNMPVRRKGLPTIAQQLKAVQETIERIAICHPSVTWQVRQNERVWFKINSGTTAKQILPQILTSVRPSDLQFWQSEIIALNEKIELKKPPKIELVLGLPDRCHRRRPDWVRVAVNNRVVRSPELEQIILASFARTLPRDRYPICFLHLQICPGQIDWNRHPAKAIVYLHSIKFWQEQVSRAIEQTLRVNTATLPIAVQNQRVGKLLKVSEGKGSYHLDSNAPTKKSKIGEIGLIELKALTQIHNTYILAEHATGIWLVEQHIAHERVLYEQLQDDWKLIPLENPIVLSQLKSTQIEQLQRLGLELETFGEQLWAIRTIPEILYQREDCADALKELSCGGDLQTAQVATACRSAIRNGTPLNLSQMQTLLNQWKNTRNPRTCPHGRPIYLSLEESALARFFRRHWVIGKSHGI
jgi:DNA mismatch repair protein MutL